jgi:hypothetical protein
MVPSANDGFELHATREFHDPAGPPVNWRQFIIMMRGSSVIQY